MQPFSHASAAAACGATGSTAAVAKARPSSGPTAGSTSAFAPTPSSGTEPNCSQRIGAVAVLHAAETATTLPTPGGTGYPSNVRSSLPATRKIAITAAN